MKKALLIGINYNNTNAKLNGCINDILQVKNMLEKQFGYSEFTILTDETPSKPTKTNIIDSINNIISDSQNCSEIYIHYSGHGVSVKDIDGDEDDGFDEALVPLDYVREGFIIDDDLNVMISKTQCNTRVVFDCCHSGSALDLYYIIQVKEKNIVKKTEKVKKTSPKGNIFLISGCSDSQTSMDSYDSLNRMPMGALTACIIRVLKENNYSITVGNLFKQLYSRLQIGGYSQTPVFSSTNDINLNAFYINKNTSRNLINNSRDIFTENNEIILEDISQLVISTKKTKNIPKSISDRQKEKNIQKTIYDKHGEMNMSKTFLNKEREKNYSIQKNNFIEKNNGGKILKFNEKTFERQSRNTIQNNGRIKRAQSADSTKSRTIQLSKNKAGYSSFNIQFI